MDKRKKEKNEKPVAILFIIVSLFIIGKFQSEGKLDLALGMPNLLGKLAIPVLLILVSIITLSKSEKTN